MSVQPGFEDFLDLPQGDPGYPGRSELIVRQDGYIPTPYENTDEDVVAVNTIYAAYGRPLLSDPSQIPREARFRPGEMFKLIFEAQRRDGIGDTIL